MKKTLIICLITMLSLCLSYGFANAAASGPCVDCHTMHNSQDGSPMRFDGNPQPIEKLLRGDCCGCHAKSGGTEAERINDGIPQVAHVDGVRDLAGGNFQPGYTSDAMAHNVLCLYSANPDDVLGNNPPGYNGAYDAANPPFGASTQLRCAGQYGCHGIRDGGETNEWDAVSGGHHGDDSMLKFGSINEAAQGADVPSSYRWLFGVHGGENTSWQNIDENSHNEYRGEDMSVRAGLTWGSTITISQLCAECHGDFHESVEITNQVAATWGPWLRHPTDYVILDSGEYASISPDYSIDAPVGRTSIPNAPSATYTPGSEVVTCLSCHKAHGSDFADILRWVQKK